MRKHQHGGDIYTSEYRIDFSANINPLGMPESVRLAACEGVALSANYPDVCCRKLRGAIAEKEQVPAEWIICGNGAADLIFSVVQAEKPGKALLTAPGFAEYEQALKAQGCAVQFYTLRKEDGFSVREDILECLTEDLDMIFLCNPNNPTGVVIAQALLEKILSLCRERNIRVILDLCFVEFLENFREADMTYAAGEYQNLFILKAFTKTYAMAGLRLGYAVCADTGLLERIGQIRQPWGVSLPAQMAGEAALKEEEYVQKARALVAKERVWLSGELKKLGFQVYASAANFLFFRGREKLADACRKQGILIRDCSNYRGLADGYYRIAVRTHEENEALVQVLKKSSAANG